MAFAETPAQAPGSGFTYSDINFIVLGALVERVSGETLETYTAKHIFAPLKMAQTLRSSGAVAREDRPTQYDENEHMLRGVVHDPTARRMGGVAGHCGIVFHGGRSGKVCPSIIERRRKGSCRRSRWRRCK